MNVDPWPGAECQRISPPDCATNREARGRPIPSPRPPAGRRRTGRTGVPPSAGVIPRPLSWTAHRSAVASPPVETRTVPPWGSPPGRCGSGCRPGGAGRRGRPRPARPWSSGSAARRTSRSSASGRASRRLARTISSGWQNRGRGSGGRATYIRSRRIRWARCAWVRIARSERTALGSVSPDHQQLGAADDHGQGVVQLVTGPGGELGQGVELRLAEPLRLRSTRPR